VAAPHARRLLSGRRAHRGRRQCNVRARRSGGSAALRSAAGVLRRPPQLALKREFLSPSAAVPANPVAVTDHSQVLTS
jgi:hypothetical protein